jgi:hypothetical protein
MKPFLILMTIFLFLEKGNLQAQCQPNAGADYTFNCCEFQLYGELSNQNSTFEWTCINNIVLFYETTIGTSGLFQGDYGTYLFVLTETNGSCVNTDTVEFIFEPLTPEAGNDTLVCDSIYEMNADTADITYGFGYWSFNEPSIYIINDNSPNAIIGYDPNTIVWSTNNTFSTLFYWIITTSGCSYTDTVRITFSQCLNKTNTLKNSNNFKIYPNPAHNNLVLTINKEQLVDKIEILDITGKATNLVFHHEKNSKTLTIDVSKLENGVYFVKIGNSIQKFIKN